MIESDNFALHEAFCKRNIKKCPKCGEPVHKNELDDHLADHENKKNENPNEEVNQQIEEDTNEGIDGDSKNLISQFQNTSQFYEIANNQISLETAKIEGPTLKCENCLKEIAESTFPLHEASCKKNIIRCPKCQEPVDKRELEYHEIEVHGVKKEIDPNVRAKNTLVPIIGISLVRKEMKSLEDIEYLMDPNVVILFYFSAHWCPPCRSFSPLLIDLYNRINKKEKRVEIVFISLDQSIEDFMEYLKVMPWISIPYTQKQRREKLTQMYRIRGIPTLYVVNKIGKVMNPNAVQDCVAPNFRLSVDELYRHWKSQVK